MHQNTRLIRLLLVATCMSGVVLAGCSSQPIPNERLAVGRSSIESAQSAGAAELAPVELNRAREKLAKATEAAQKKEYLLARRMADEADVDAQVARTKANAQRSVRAADEITASLRTLREQLNRYTDSGLMPTAPAAGPGETPRYLPPSFPPDNRNSPGTPGMPR